MALYSAGMLRHTAYAYYIFHLILLPYRYLARRRKLARRQRIKVYTTDAEFATLEYYHPDTAHDFGADTSLWLVAPTFSARASKVNVSPR